MPPGVGDSFAGRPFGHPRGGRTRIFKARRVPVEQTRSGVSIGLEQNVLQLETQVVTGQATAPSSRDAANAVAVLTGTLRVADAMTTKYANAAIDALKDYQFKPAIAGPCAVAARMAYTFTFK